MALTFVTDIKRAGGEANDVWLYAIGFAARLIIWTAVRIVLRLTAGLNQFGDGVFDPPRQPAGGGDPE